MCINRKLASLAKFTDSGNDTRGEGGVLIWLVIWLAPIISGNHKKITSQPRTCIRYWVQSSSVQWRPGC